jgi:hypothetical protein
VSADPNLSVRTTTAVEVEVRDHLERSPDLFPPAAKVGDVEPVDERALERRHPTGPAGEGLGDDAAAEVRQPVKSARRGERRRTHCPGSSTSAHDVG